MFEAGKFNLELFQYVIDEHFKQKQEDEEKAKKEKEEEEEAEQETEAGSWYSSILGTRPSVKSKAVGWVTFLFVLTLLAVMAYSFWPSVSFSSF